MGTIVLNPFEIFAGEWTPLNLGSKLLNWWDGTIVDEIPATEVNSWLDQKGSIDWANNGNKPTYDGINNKIIFEASKFERLESDSNASSFNRSAGAYAFAINRLGGASIYLSLTDNTVNNKHLSIQTLGLGSIRIQYNSGAGQVIKDSTTTAPLGKNILYFGQTGSSFEVILNNIDISSEFTADSAWEDLALWNTISLSALIRAALTYTNSEIHEILRMDDQVTNNEKTNIYNYLNDKY